jgi:hypothetical protein
MLVILYGVIAAAIFTVFQWRGYDKLLLSLLIFALSLLYALLAARPAWIDTILEVIVG